jgi:hypothetical protein
LNSDFHAPWVRASRWNGCSENGSHWSAQACFARRSACNQGSGKLPHFMAPAALAEPHAVGALPAMECCS